MKMVEARPQKSLRGFGFRVTPNQQEIGDITGEIQRRRHCCHGFGLRRTRNNPAGTRSRPAADDTVNRCCGHTFKLDWGGSVAKANEQGRDPRRRLAQLTILSVSPMDTTPGSTVDP